MNKIKDVKKRTNFKVRITRKPQENIQQQQKQGESDLKE